MQTWQCPSPTAFNEYWEWSSKMKNGHFLLCWKTKTGRRQEEYSSWNHGSTCSPTGKLIWNMLACEIIRTGRWWVTGGLRKSEIAQSHWQKTFQTITWDWLNRFAPAERWRSGRHQDRTPRWIDEQSVCWALVYCGLINSWWVQLQRPRRQYMHTQADDCKKWILSKGCT